MLGIHQFKIDNNYSCYLLERPFGNFLVFIDLLEEINHDFLQSKGGIYKQFIESSESINLIHSQLFKRYGCSVIGAFQVEQFSKLSPIERYGIDYVDPQVQLMSHGEAKWMEIYQKETNVIIMGNSFCLKFGNRISQAGKDQTNKWMNTFNQKNVKYVFFCHFETQGHLELNKSFSFNIFNFLKK